MKRSFISNIGEHIIINNIPKKAKTKTKTKTEMEDINLYNQKNEHLLFDLHFDAHNDMPTELKKHFLPSHHQTNPLLAEVFEISEDIEKNKQQIEKKEQQIEKKEQQIEKKEQQIEKFEIIDEFEIIDLRTTTITLLEIRKKKVAKIIREINANRIPAELADELMFILELFE